MSCYSIICNRTVAKNATVPKPLIEEPMTTIFDSNNAKFISMCGHQGVYSTELYLGENFQENEKLTQFLKKNKMLNKFNSKPSFCEAKQQPYIPLDFITPISVYHSDIETELRVLVGDIQRHIGIDKGISFTTPQFLKIEDERFTLDFDLHFKLGYDWHSQEVDTKNGGLVCRYSSRPKGNLRNVLDHANEIESFMNDLIKIDNLSLRVSLHESPLFVYDKEYKGLVEYIVYKNCSLYSTFNSSFLDDLELDLESLIERCEKALDEYSSDNLYGVKYVKIDEESVRLNLFSA
jgi:hypothetical protein